MLESDLYNKHLKVHCRKTVFYRIENRLNVGTPDMYFVNRNVAGFMEAKKLVVTASTNGSVTIPFRPAQLAWLLRHTKVGGMSVLGMITDLGVFFALGANIQETYTRESFHNAMRQKESPLRFVEDWELEDFFQSLRLYAK